MILRLFEYNKFNLVNDVSSSLSNILPYIKINGNLLYASTDIDKSGYPIVRIDSKKSIVGILLKFNINSMEIKSIINNTSERGIGGRLLKIILGKLEPGYNIIVNQDVSGGYWERVIKEYPQFKWSFI